MRRPPTTEDFASPVHDTRVVARLGVWLGAAFLICFLAGLISHLHQHPIAWLPISPSPAWAYRVTQGLHVATGVACVPLLRPMWWPLPQPSIGAGSSVAPWGWPRVLSC